MISESKALSMHHTVSGQKYLPYYMIMKEKVGRAIPIYLFYKKQKLIIKGVKGMSYDKLKELLYGEILKYEYNRVKNLETAKK